MNASSFAVKNYAASEKLAGRILLIALLALILCPLSAFAQCTISWSGGASGSWNTGTNWTPSGPPSGASNTCISTASSAVTLNSSGATDNLTLGLNTDSLTIANNTTLSVTAGGNISNAGSILIGGGNNGTFLSIAGATTLSGAGTLTMSNSTNNQISGGGTLTNSSTIQGSGQIGAANLTLVNSGTIDANQSTTLFINPNGGTTNTGTIEASAGGVLQFNTYGVTNTGGTIQSTGTGSTVNLFTGSITGGTLTSTAGGSINDTDNFTLNTVTISTGSAVNVLNNTTLNLGAGTITNNGAINLGGGNNGTFLSIAGSTTLAGSGGIVTMSNSTNNQISGGGTLTNQQTIQGSGQIGAGNLTLVNSGTIDANQSTTLLINPNGGTTNTGMMEATAGGILQFNTDAVNNAGGTILATGTSGGMSPTPSTVNLFTGSITGGTLTSTLGGVIDVTDTFTVTNVTISTNSAVNVLNNTQLSLGAGTITNNGAINLNGGNNGTDLIINGGSVTLTGGGTVNLSNSTNNAIEVATAGDTLTNTNNTISGAGQIGAATGMLFVNQAGGIVDANASGGTLTINPSNGASTPVGSTTNLGLLEASGGGILQVENTVTNTGGTIEALAGGTVNLNGTDLIGGTLTSVGTGVIQGYNSALLDGTSGHAVTITSGTNFDIPNSFVTVIAGTITNNGTINVQAGNNGTDLEITSSATLAGTGNVTMSNSTNNAILGGGTLTNQETIQGAGQIGAGNLTLINSSSGVIDANQSTTLFINPNGGTTNTGLMEATAGGTLEFETDAVTNTNGTISAGTGSQVVLFTGSITGGTLTSTGTGAFNVTDNFTLNTLTLSTGSTLNILNSEQLNLGAGTITNNGTINLNGGNNGTILAIAGATTLAGTGNVTMSNSTNNEITGGGTLTNQETIQGAGQIGASSLTLVNTSTGVIDANQSTTLLINPNGGTTNTGLMEATAGGTLEFETDAVTNTGGTISAGTGSQVVLFTGSITGGTLTSTGTGAFNVTDNFTLNTLTLSTGGTLNLLNNTQLNLGAGTFTNNGTINVNGGNNGTILAIAGATTLAGTGKVAMSNSTNNQITGGGTLTNEETIQGSGQLGANSLTLVNTSTGLIDANQSTTLFINASGGTTNTGKMEATTGGTLEFETDAVVNTGGTIEAIGTGSTVNLFTGGITGGTLTSNTGGAFNETDNFELTSVTISSGSTLNILNNTQLQFGTGTITNDGTINVNGGNNGTDIYINGNVTLAGTGKVIMSASNNNQITGNGGTFTNDSTIEGQGNIGEAAIALVNEGTIEASVSGGTLFIDPNGSGLTNNLGTKSGILDVLAHSTMIVEGGGLTNYNATTNTLTGGEYEVTGTLEFNAGANGIEINDADIILTSNTAAILNTGASNASALVNFSDNGTKGLFTVNSGTFTDTNNFTNSGTLTAGSGGTLDFSTGLTNFNSGTNTLTGGTYDVTGTLEFAGANIVINDASITLTGTAPKILNSTTSANALAGFNDNKGTFTVNGGTFTDANSFTNTGTLAAGAKGLFDASSGLTNFNSTNGTLTGGSYTLTTTGQIQFNNEGFANDIVTNDAKITLAGVDTTVSPIIDQNGANALANFATNGASGSLLLTTDRVFTNSGSLTNAGIVNVEISSGTGKTELIIGGPGVYTQTGGTTTVDGVLSASGGINIQGGFLYGNALTKTGTEGTLIGAVDLTGGTLNPGNAVKLLGTIDITGSFTESGAGILNIDLDGTVAGTKYDVLNVSGTAALGGTIDFVLNAAFKPVVGDTWDVLNYASETGSFTTVDLPTAPAGDHYSFTCGATDCILSLLSGPSAATQPTSKGTVSGAPATRVSRSAGVVTSTTTHEPVAILAKVTCFAGRLLGSESCGREAAATVASSGEAHAASSGGGEVHNNIMVATRSVSAGRGAASHETSASAMARLYVCAYFPASVGHTMGCSN